MAFDYQNSQVYFRDSFVPFKEANISIAGSAVLYGLSVYTVLSASWNEKENQLYIYRLADHWQRLAQSARIMGMADFGTSMPQSRFLELVTALLKQNNITEDILIRATIFIDELLAGTRIDGLKNSFTMYAYPMGAILNPEGIHACVSSWVRTSDNMIPARAKVNGGYVNASLMKNEALLNGYDDAIALDASGHVAEGTVANLFIIRDQTLITPDTSTDILEGITRRSLVKIAADLGIVCEIRPVDRSELYIADEVFMCGSSARIVPILSIDKRQVGDGKFGKLTRQILDRYVAIQRGEAEAYSDWLSAV